MQTTPTSLGGAFSSLHVSDPQVNDEHEIINSQESSQEEIIRKFYLLTGYSSS